MEIAQKEGLGRRINTVMSTAFFELTSLMTREEYLPLLKEEIKNSYGKNLLKLLNVTGVLSTKLLMP